MHQSPVIQEKPTLSTRLFSIQWDGPKIISARNWKCTSRAKNILDTRARWSGAFMIFIWSRFISRRSQWSSPWNIPSHIPVLSWSERLEITLRLLANWRVCGVNLKMTGLLNTGCWTTNSRDYIKMKTSSSISPWSWACWPSPFRWSGYLAWTLWRLWSNTKRLPSRKYSEHTLIISPWKCLRRSLLFSSWYLP